MLRRIVWGYMNRRFGRAAAEWQAMGDVIDTSALQDEPDALDREMSADTKATRRAMHVVKSEVSYLRSDVKVASLQDR